MNEAMHPHYNLKRLDHVMKLVIFANRWSAFLVTWVWGFMFREQDSFVHLVEILWYQIGNCIE